jgi:hypothetical protein
MRKIVLALSLLFMGVTFLASYSKSSHKVSKDEVRVALVLPQQYD